jgi:pilus assembly protein Flp/PilA
MREWKSRFRAFFKSESGATATEYAVMIAMVILVCLVAVSALGDKVSDSFTRTEQEWSAL